MTERVNQEDSEIILPSIPRATLDGRIAYAAGIPVDFCPWKRYAELAFAWRIGWHKAHLEDKL